jgi:ER-bound oxygenase mpaB/B'/Rubber oxygenase, catalytic domain
VSEAQRGGPVIDALSDVELDAFRSQGDRVLDPIVAHLGSSPGATAEMLAALFRTDHIPAGDARFQMMLDAVATPPVVDTARVEAGQRLFQLYGPEVLLILGCYALPAAYAAASGVQVIHRSRRLQDDAKRRLCETAQMVINVMQPGGLAEGGIGTRAAVKVRLMHALVRHHVQNVQSAAGRGPWTGAWGCPINQEDLTGTLLTFSLLVLDGLRKIGAQVSIEEERGYLELWRHVGGVLGIDARLTAACVADPAQLAVQIGRRQIRPCPEGRELAKQLAAAVDALFPLPGYGLSLMHFFLDDSAFGIDLATTLALPPPNWTAALVRTRAWQKRFALRWLNRVPGARTRRRFLARLFAQRLILLQHPDRHLPFEVPKQF